MLGIITLPTDITAQISTQASGVFTDLAPIAVFIIGILLGLFVINWIIRLINPHSISEERERRFEMGEDIEDIERDLPL